MADHRPIVETTPAPGLREEHGVHDLELVARAAAGDATAAESVRAADLQGTCAACALLDADLRVITAATRALAGSATPRLPRDFRLTAADAARLRPQGLLPQLSALLGGLGHLRSRTAAGLMTLGLVGLLVASGVPGTLSNGLGFAGGAATGATKAGSTPEAALAPASTDTRAFLSTPLPHAAGIAGPDGSPTPAPASSGLGALFLGVVSLLALLVGAAQLVAARREHQSAP